MHCLHNNWFYSGNRKKRKSNLHVYLEECEYRAKKMQISRFINTELKSDSESSDSDLVLEKIGSKFDTE